jgi:hypothetical protein
MAVYHINEAGDPGRCRAVVGACPFGGPEDHYLDKDDAREAYELKQTSNFGPEHVKKLVGLNTRELQIIDAKLLQQALRISKAQNGTEREIIEIETQPIAIIRAVRVEEREVALQSAGALN